MRSLLELLRGRALKQPLSEQEFDDLLQAAEEENVQAWAAWRLRERGGEFTPAQSKRIEEIHRSAQLSAFFWTETLKSTLRAFERAQLPVIALKGPCMAKRLYGDAALRACYDLDLLVRSADWTRAGELLTGLGFSANSHADDYHQSWGRKGINLELHYGLENPSAFELDTDGVWARAQFSQFDEVPVRLLAPDDELLYLCLHAVRHRFERLSLMLDLALAFRRLPAAAPEETERGHPVFENILALGWMMAARLNAQFDSETEPEARAETAGAPAWRVSPRERQRLQRLADRLWDELMQAPPPALDWAAQHRFYLELETPGWNRIRRRWRHGGILLTRLIDDDFVFAGRFHLHRNWQVRLLRPIRLLMKTLRPAAMKR